MSLPCANWLTTYETREAWAADARNGAPDFSVGSSTVYAMLGLCPNTWGNLWTVYRAALEGAGPQVDTDQDQLQRGQDWEPAVVRWHAAHRSQDCTHEAPLCRVSPPGLEWLRPSPDAFVMDDEEGWGVSEIKVLHASQARCFEQGATYTSLEQVEERLKAGLPAIPMHYMAQCMTMLAASGLPWCELVAVFAWDWKGVEQARMQLGVGRTLALDAFIDAGAIQVKTVRVERDEYALRSLVTRIRDLRHRHLVHGQEPAPSNSGAYWEKLAREADGTRVANDAEAQALRHLAERKRRLKAEEDDVKQMQAEIASVIAPHKTLVVPQNGQRAGRATLTSNGQLRLSGL